ncbi:MAG TPA: nitroreductase family protein, partial [Desulfotignum sp.]|nr:nitroreductase family protein [Desulfotignum sp.]
YLELALPGFGLGSCWAGYVNYAAGQWPPLAEFLSFPENHSCHGALMVGFPKFRYSRAPRRNHPVVRYHETFSRQESEAENEFNLSIDYN